MKQEALFQKTENILKEINDQFHYLRTVTGSLNDLELELLAANSRFLATHVEILRKANQQTAEPAQQTKTVAAEMALPKPSQAPELAPEEHAAAFDIGSVNTNEQPEPDEHPVQDEPVPIRHELTMEEAGADWDEETDDSQPATGNETADDEIQKQPLSLAPESKPGEISESTPPAAQQPVRSPETEHIPTLNERMSAQMVTSRVTDQLNAQPITDLKTTVSLNDKMLFVKDLFNGYTLAYSEAIEILNRFKSFAEAERFLQANYVEKNSWADRQTTADRFYALLQRRYS